jgi:hypothetical protein
VICLFVQFVEKRAVHHGGQMGDALVAHEQVFGSDTGKHPDLASIAETK